MDAKELNEILDGISAVAGIGAIFVPGMAAVAPLIKAAVPVLKAAIPVIEEAKPVVQAAWDLVEHKKAQGMPHSEAVAHVAAAINGLRANAEAAIRLQEQMDRG